MATRDGEEPRRPVPLQIPDAPEARTASGELLSRAEALSLIRAASNRAPTGIRNRALMAMLYRCGLRPGEALSLYPRDVDTDRGIVAVPPRKGGTGRFSGIDAVTRAMIDRWLHHRAERRIGTDEPLFCTLAGEPLKAAYVRELLPRLARKAGIAKRVHPLGLRYTHAAELSAEGFPTPLIDRHLGVAVAGSARRYLPNFSQEEIVEAVAARVWDPAP